MSACHEKDERWLQTMDSLSWHTEYLRASDRALNLERELAKSREENARLRELIDNPVAYVWPDSEDNGYYSACYTPSAIMDHLLLVIKQP